MDQKIDTYMPFLSSDAKAVIAVPSATHKNAAAFDKVSLEASAIGGFIVFYSHSPHQQPPKTTNGVFPVLLKHQRDAAYCRDALAMLEKE